MAYKDYKKLILNSPAGDNPDAPCAKKWEQCLYNKFNQCIKCGGIKGRKQYRQDYSTSEGYKK